MSGRLAVPKLGTELLENLEPVLDSPQTVWVVYVIIYATNYGLGVVGPEMTMDLWNRCLVRGLPTDSPLLVCVVSKILLEMDDLNCVERNC